MGQDWRFDGGNSQTPQGSVAVNNAGFCCRNDVFVTCDEYSTFSSYEAEKFGHLPTFKHNCRIHIGIAVVIFKLNPVRNMKNKSVDPVRESRQLPSTV